MVLVKICRLLAGAGKTIVFVTHSLAEAVFLADRIAVMTAARPHQDDHRGSGTPSAFARFMLEPRFSTLRNELYALLRDEIGGPWRRRAVHPLRREGFGAMDRSSWPRVRSRSAFSRSRSPHGTD